MDQQAIIADYEKRAAQAGLNIGQLCEAAGLHPTTFSRWKISERNPNPVGMNFSSMAAIERALEAAHASRKSEAEAASTALCAVCELRAEDPSVASCTSADCPRKVKDAA